MRLVCPNCGAQYEVDDRVIPEGGRDVQCSNCGHAWFQRPADWQESHPSHLHPPESQLPDEPTDHEEPEEDEVDDDALPEPIEEPDAPIEAETKTTIGLDDLPDLEPETEDDEPDLEPELDEDAPQPSPEPALPRRTMDDSVREILSEEAEREIQARAQDADPMESQPELGISDFSEPEDERRRIARERLARMRGIEEGETLEPEVLPEDEPEFEEAGAHNRGRDLFPDIDEINSTLDSPQYPQDDLTGETSELTTPRQTGSAGFRRGFTLIVGLLAVAALIYVYAPKLIDMVPALEPFLTAYVEAVNGLLLKIQGGVEALIAKLEAMAGEE